MGRPQKAQEQKWWLELIGRNRDETIEYKGQRLRVCRNDAGEIIAYHHAPCDGWFPVLDYLPRCDTDKTWATHLCEGIDECDLKRPAHALARKVWEQSQRLLQEAAA